MEAIVRPLAWEEWPERSRGLFQSMRSPDGEEIVLERNVFVERILPASVMRGLSEPEMEVYRRPYLEAGESRRPTLTWPARFHWTASRPTWWQLSKITPNGCRSATSPSCSSTRTRGPS